MIQRSRKDVAWIVSAFLLLSAVSIYKQISVSIFPNDPNRPVIVYIFYLALLAGWWVSIRIRITHRSVRVLLLAENYLMLIGITAGLLQDTFIFHEIFVIRLCRYITSLTIILIPLFGLFAALNLDLFDEHHFNRYWLYLFITAGVILILLFINKKFQLLNPLLNFESYAYFDLQLNNITVAFIIWSFFLEFTRVYIIYRRNRTHVDDAQMKSALCIVTASMLMVDVFYLLMTIFINKELIEYYIFIFFIEVLIWESCIFFGMVPVNTYYAEVFDRSSIAMQIVYDDGRPYMKSASAPELSAEMFNMLKERLVVCSAEGIETHLRNIRGGYSIWQNDISQTLAVINELQKSMEKLEYDSVILSQELKIQSDEASVKEQNEIYNQLTSEINNQLILLNGLLHKLETESDDINIFKKICLIGTYIKRRCNLRLVEQSEGVISNQELFICLNEMINSLRSLGVEADISWSSSKLINPEFALFVIDVFELILENEDFNINSFKITLRDDGVFLYFIKPNDISHSWPSDNAILGISKFGNKVKWIILENGYQALLSGG